MKYFNACVLLIIGFIGNSSQNDPSNELLNLADKIPGFENVNSSDLPTIDDATKLFKEKCIKVAGEEAGEAAYDETVKAKDRLEECVKKEINVTVLQEEIENAKPTGDLDVVFGKYCGKSEKLMNCAKNLTNTVDPCLEDKEKENKRLILNITESLVNFLCYKDGDRIAMFIAEGGIECLSDKQEAIQNCVNSTFSKNVPKEMPTVDKLPLFVIEKEHCDDFMNLQLCVVEELEKCKEPTPGNIVESLFKYIRKLTPCRNENSDTLTSNREFKASSAVTVMLSGPLVIGTLLMKYLWFW